MNPFISNASINDSADPQSVIQKIIEDAVKKYDHLSSNSRYWTSGNKNSFRFSERSVAIMNEVFDQLLDKKYGPYVTGDDLKYLVDQLKETKNQVQKWFERKRGRARTKKNKNLHSSAINTSKVPVLCGSTNLDSMATTLIAHQSISVPSTQIMNPPLWTPPPFTGPSIPAASNFLPPIPTSATVPSSLPLFPSVTAPNILPLVPNAKTHLYTATNPNSLPQIKTSATPPKALSLIPTADSFLLNVSIPPTHCTMTEEQINPDEEFPPCFVKKFAANNYICNACRSHVLQKSFAEPLTWEAKITQLLRYSDYTMQK